MTVDSPHRIVADVMDEFGIETFGQLVRMIHENGVNNAIELRDKLRGEEVAK